LVDGNNLMGRLGGGTREGLVSELCDLARRRRKKLTVVFDGPPGPGRPKVQAFGDVTVVYAAPRSADEEIVRRIREAREPRGVTVITDDRALASAVAGAGARISGIDVFSRDASARMKRSGGPGEEKDGPPLGLKDWERWFSDPRNRIE
jgi:predicted RNA-binding protein with PIN domain